MENSVEGECPKCGSADLDYSTPNVSGGGVYFDVECEGCGITFQEWFEIEFDAHFMKEDK